MSGALEKKMGNNGAAMNSTSSDGFGPPGQTSKSE